MPAGVPVGTLAIGEAGAVNAALLGGGGSFTFRSGACRTVGCMAGGANGSGCGRAGRPMTPLPPNSTIGIVGGGQLGRMLASAAGRLGYRTIVLEPAQDAPAAQFANRHIVAAYDDEVALADLVSASDVVTYEFENVPLAAAAFLEKTGSLYPPARALEVAQDRLVEKTTLQDMGVQVAPFLAVNDADGLRAALQAFGGGVLKTRRFGYDGKGQHVFRTVDGDLPNILASTGTGPWVLEKLIDFQREASIICARGQDGTVACFDAAENLHENGILRQSTVPARGVDEPALQAIAARIAEGLDYVGVLSWSSSSRPTGRW